MMSDQEFYDRFDSALKRGAILCLLFAAMCFTALAAEHAGRASHPVDDVAVGK